MKGPHLQVLVDGALDGATNMARDRAVWRAREEGETESPFLRLYAWSPRALSLGFHQPAADVELDHFQRREIEVVRRPTGGAAVLHADEITYALSAPLGVAGLGRSVHEIYDAVAGALVDALRELGVRAECGGAGRPEGFACFGAAGGHEITVDGRKLVGSAQRRGRAAFLQHGSILTGPGHLEIFADDESGRRRRRWLAERTTDLSQLGHGELSPNAMAESLAVALVARTGGSMEWLESVPSSITRRESGLLAEAAAPSLRS